MSTFLDYYKLAKENKKFFFGQIKKEARSSEFEKAIQWLIDSVPGYRVDKLNYQDQEWMVNIPLYAVCNLEKKRKRPN